jgi:hypothetical protein
VQKTLNYLSAEYAIMLAVILVIIFGVLRMIGSNANTVFSQTDSIKVECFL